MLTLGPSHGCPPKRKLVLDTDRHISLDWREGTKFWFVALSRRICRKQLTFVVRSMTHSTSRLTCNAYLTLFILLNFCDRVSSKQSLVVAIDGRKESVVGRSSLRNVVYDDFGRPLGFNVLASSGRDRPSRAAVDPSWDR